MEYSKHDDEYGQGYCPVCTCEPTVGASERTPEALKEKAKRRVLAIHNFKIDGIVDPEFGFEIKSHLQNALCQRLLAENNVSKMEEILEDLASLEAADYKIKYMDLVMELGDKI